MITFDYYNETFNGKLNETQFNEVKDEAILVYENYTLKPVLTKQLLDLNQDGAKAIKFSICAIIDNLHRGIELREEANAHLIRIAKGIKSEKVASHSVTFGDNSLSDIESALTTTNQSIMRKYLLRYGLLNRSL